MILDCITMNVYKLMQLSKMIAIVFNQHQLNK